MFVGGGLVVDFAPLLFLFFCAHRCDTCCGQLSIVLVSNCLRHCYVMFCSYRCEMCCGQLSILLVSKCLRMILFLFVFVFVFERLVLHHVHLFIFKIVHFLSG